MAEQDSITVEMDMPRDVETVKVKFPCLLAVDKDIFQPRLPSYLKKMASADREITVLSLADMDDTDEQHYGLNGSPTQVRRIFPPSSDVRHEYWDDDSETVTDRLFGMLKERKFI